MTPRSIGSDAETLLQEYVDIRFQSGSISLANEAERQALLVKANRVMDDLWSYAWLAAEKGGYREQGKESRTLNWRRKDLISNCGD
jgi:hypothetical protein